MVEPFSMKTYFTERVVRYLAQLPRTMVELPFPEGFNKPVDVALETWVSGNFGSAVVLVRLNDLKRLFQT